MCFFLTDVLCVYRPLLCSRFLDLVNPWQATCVLSGKGLKIFQNKKQLYVYASWKWDPKYVCNLNPECKTWDAQIEGVDLNLQKRQTNNLIRNAEVLWVKYLDRSHSDNMKGPGRGQTIRERLHWLTSAHIASVRSVCGRWHGHDTNNIWHIF